MDSSTQDELLARWRSGDLRAGRQLLRANMPTLRRFFANKAGSQLDDLIQETLARCVEGLARFEGRASFRSYMLGVARNVWLETLRERYGPRVDTARTSLVDLGMSPSEHYRRDAARQQVMQALRELPLDHQVLLELYYWEECSLAEIAEILEIPKGTVKSRLHAARGTFERQFKRSELLRGFRP